MPDPVTVVGIGGSTRASSSTERLVVAVLNALEAGGAQTILFSGDDLVLPPYDPTNPTRPESVRSLLEQVRRADGLVIGTPGYHGTISGLVKNVLDYLEDLRNDQQPYLNDKPVGCIVTANGWQAAVTTLVTLRQIAHALRGWPTPLGLAVNVAAHPFDRDGSIKDGRVADSIRIMADQLLFSIHGGRLA